MIRPTLRVHVGVVSLVGGKLGLVEELATRQLDLLLCRLLSLLRLLLGSSLSPVNGRMWVAGACVACAAQ